jgi:diguanylate cyclase (GGDEF)-like protein
MKRQSGNFVLRNLEPVVDNLVSTLDLPEADRDVLKDRRNKAAFAEVAIRLHEVEAEHVRRLDEANSDPLTGLLNRRRFKERYEALEELHPDIKTLEFEFDCANLKQANEVESEKAGDALLIGCASTIKSIVRPETILSRWGGDEIKGVIPLSAEDEAEPIIARLVQAFAGRRGGRVWSIDERTAIRLKGRFGFVIVDGNQGQTIADGLEKASEAMYEEKKRQKKRDAEDEAHGLGKAAELAYVVRDGVIVEEGYEPDAT